jgi:hypothetical protein
MVAGMLAAPAALAAPTPSPSLQTILVGPAEAGYQEGSSGQGYTDGPLTADGWAGDNTRMLAELRRDNFVSGYARTWINSAHDKGMVEAVAAFDGQRDATSFLNFVQASPSDAFYVRAITVSGIDSFVGAHYADPSRPEYQDDGIFIKGNDLFILVWTAKTDDLGDAAATQARRQFDAAPRYSIPPGQWPENVSRSSPRTGAALVPIAAGAVGILLLGLLAILGAVVLIVRRQGPAAGVGTPAAAAAATPAAAAAPAAAVSGPHMSADGRYWWDGTVWRDAEHHMPPGAMRSADGYYWWDGRSWRTAPPS